MYVCNCLQLRFLQTLAEIATEKNSTIVFPVPIDIIRAFTERGGAVAMPNPLETLEALRAEPAVKGPEPPPEPTPE